jgi:bifunctional DNase/RNase
MRRISVVAPVIIGCIAALTTIARETPADQKSDDAGSIKGQNDKANAVAPREGMIELEILRLEPGPVGGVLVLLVEKNAPFHVIPMVIGEAEGRAISMRKNGTSFSRPMTHDLLEKVIEEFKTKVVKLEIGALQDGVFIGTLYLKKGKRKTVKLDVRPSDGIALATGAGVPIYVAAEVINEVGEPRRNWGAGAAR